MGVLALSSCQTVGGVGKDLNNFGKNVFAKKPTTLPAAPKIEAPKQAPPLQVEAKKSEPAAPKPKAPAGKSFLEGAWENVWKPFERKPDSSHKPSSLKRLEPQLSHEETPQPMSLEDLPDNTDIEAVPSKVEPWEGGSTVDLNGDGIPDVRYRQRDSK